MYYQITFLNLEKDIWIQIVEKQQQPPGRGVLEKRGVLRNFANFTGKYLCQSLFLNKVAGPRSATLLKKRLWHRYFPVSFAKFLRTPSLTEHLRWLYTDTDNLNHQENNFYVNVLSRQRCFMSRVYSNILRLLDGISLILDKE